tara:strand:+ start:7085 stop:8785 length:1701 start_codon:yes stop_codon:yes gene_type:complete
MEIFWENNRNKSTNELIELINKNPKEYKENYKILINNYINFISKKTKIKNILKYNKMHNLFDYSLIHEMSFYKSPNIINIIKFLALKKIIKENPNININLNISDKNIYNIFSNFYNKGNCKLLYNGLNIKIKKTNTFKELIKVIYFSAKLLFVKVIFIKKKIFFKNNTIFLSYFDNYENKNTFKSLYWDKVISYLNKRKDINIIHVENDKYSIKDNILNIIKINKINVQDNNNHILLLDFLKIRDIFKSVIFVLKCFIKLNLSFIRVNNDNLDNNIINYYFEDEIIKSTKGLHLFENLLFLKSFENMMNISKKKLDIIYLFENQSWEKILKKSSKSNSYYGFVHSTVRYWDLRYLSDTESINYDKNFYILNTGNISKKNLKDNGIASEKFIDVESIRFLKYKNIRHEYNKNNNILIVGDYISSINYRLLKILNEIENKINCKIFFKNHPNKNINFNIFNKNIKEFNKDNLKTEKFDLIICNYPSSAIIDFYLLNKKIIIFYEKNELNTSPLFTIKEANYFSNSKELLNYIEKIDILKNNKIDDDFLYLNNNILKWKSFITKFGIYD